MNEQKSKKKATELALSSGNSNRGSSNTLGVRASTEVAAGSALRWVEGRPITDDPLTTVSGKRGWIRAVI